MITFLKINVLFKEVYLGSDSFQLFGVINTKNKRWTTYSTKSSPGAPSQPSKATKYSTLLHLQLQRLSRLMTFLAILPKKSDIEEPPIKFQ